MEKNSSPSCLSSCLGSLLLGTIALLGLVAYGTSWYGWQIYLELFSHFQVQYLVTALVLLGLLAVLRRKSFTLIGLFLCTLLAMPIVSWYVPPQRLLTASSETDLRVLVANINTQNASYNKVIEMVRSEKPDVAVMIEVNQTWKEALDSLSDILPYSSGQPHSSNFGLLVYSNIPLNNAQIQFFGTENIPSVVTQFTVQNQPITMIATHPLPPVKPQAFQSRNRQFDLIIQYLESVGDESVGDKSVGDGSAGDGSVGDRVILAGDLNASMWSPYYRRLENRTGLRNAREGFGILPTWPTSNIYQPIPGWITSLFLIPIDHCLISTGWDVTNIHTGAETDSDHRPLVVDLKITHD